MVVPTIAPTLSGEVKGDVNINCCNPKNTYNGKEILEVRRGRLQVREGTCCCFSPCKKPNVEEVRAAVLEALEKKYGEKPTALAMQGADLLKGKVVTLEKLDAVEKTAKKASDNWARFRRAYRGAQMLRRMTSPEDDRKERESLQASGLSGFKFPDVRAESSHQTHSSSDEKVSSLKEGSPKTDRPEIRHLEALTQTRLESPTQNSRVSFQEEARGASSSPLQVRRVSSPDFSKIENPNILVIGSSGRKKAFDKDFLKQEIQGLEFDPPLTEKEIELVVSFVIKDFVGGSRTKVHSEEIEKKLARYFKVMGKQMIPASESRAIEKDLERLHSTVDLLAPETQLKLLELLERIPDSSKEYPPY